MPRMNFASSDIRSRRVGGSDVRVAETSPLIRLIHVGSETRCILAQSVACTRSVPTVVNVDNGPPDQWRSREVPCDAAVKNRSGNVLKT